MKNTLLTALLPGALITGLLTGVCSDAVNAREGRAEPLDTGFWAGTIQVGVRPYFLVDDMDEGPLKQRLKRCGESAFEKTDFSIGHRGAPLQFPEHTRESYIAAARMGAGIVECDVTFTRDKELVCRHAQCDLHTTTNIVATELGRKCREPFKPAVYNASGALVSPASARCCTSDITLAEFKSLLGKMDASDPMASTPEQYLAGTASWRTDIHAGRGTLMTHRESIALFQRMKVRMTPELKAPEVAMPFEGFTQQDYARKMIREYQDAGVAADNVRPQSFQLEDVLFWLHETPEFGRQAVYLDERMPSAEFDTRDTASLEPAMRALASQGVRVIGPPLWMLLDVDDGIIVPSAYASAANRAGLDIVTWSLERSGPLSGGGGYYFQTLNGLNRDTNNPQPAVISKDGDLYTVLDVLAREVGVKGVFSDWPGTVTYYANCMGL